LFRRLYRSLRLEALLGADGGLSVERGGYPREAITSVIE
jgi:hypothetical protein